MRSVDSDCAVSSCSSRDPLALLLLGLEHTRGYFLTIALDLARPLGDFCLQLIVPDLQPVARHTRLFVEAGVFDGHCRMVCQQDERMSAHCLAVHAFTSDVIVDSGVGPVRFRLRCSR